MSGLRVIHVMDHSLPGGDGYSIRAKYLLEAQAAAGNEVTVLTSPSQGTDAVDATIAGVTYRRSFYSTAEAALVRRGAKHLVFGQAIQRALLGLLDAGRADILHAHTPFTVARPVLKVARERGIPFVYEKRNLWEESAKARGKTSGRWPFYEIARAMDRSVTRRADAICVITQALKQRTCDSGVEPERVFVVGNGVDTDAFHPVPPDGQLRESCLRGGSFVFGFIGSFFRFEGLPFLVEAFADLRARYPGARLVLVGDGEDRAEVERRVAELGLNEVVWQVGRVPHAQVEGFYSAMDALVYPRLKSDLTDLISPLKPLEALAMGRCAIGSDVGGIRELIGHEDTGLLFRAGDRASLVEQMSRLASHEFDVQAMGRRARDRMVAGRQWRQMAAAYDNAYVHARASRGR